MQSGIHIHKVVTCCTWRTGTYVGMNCTRRRIIINRSSTLFARVSKYICVRMYIYRKRMYMSAVQKKSTYFVISVYERQNVAKCQVYC